MTFAFNVPLVVVRTSVVVEFKHADVATHDLLSTQAIDTVQFIILF